MEGDFLHWMLSAVVSDLLLFRSSRFCACNALKVNTEHTEPQEDTLILSCLLGWRIYRINPIKKARCFQRGEGIPTSHVFSYPTCTSKATVANGTCTRISAYLLWLNMFAQKWHTCDPQEEYISQMKGFCLFVWSVLFCLVLLFDSNFINLSQDIIASMHSNINVWDLIKATGWSALQGLIQCEQAELSEHSCVRQLSVSSRDAGRTPTWE